MTFTYQHDFRTFTAEIHRIGPAIQVVAYEGEFYASLAIGYMQSGDSTAVISKWEVDGPAECQQLTGTNADWDRYGRPSLRSFRRDWPRRSRRSRTACVIEVDQ